ncbi:MAG TPA: nucleotide-binding protein [Myxococcaceae bacterium]|jgi:hypothetical protein
MNILVLANPGSRNLHRIQNAFDETNRVQSYFRFELEMTRELPDQPRGRKLRPEALREIARKYKTPEVLGVLAVTESPFTGRLVTEEYSDVALISLNGWETRFAPPPSRTFIQYALSYALLGWASDLSDERLDAWYHPKPKGCLADYYKGAEDLRRSMIAANLCADCEAFLVSMGIPAGALAAVENLLGHVRGMAIRRPRTLPRSVFIGHGRSSAWEGVRDFIKDELKLPIQEFNEEETAGTATTARLSAMLDASAFAILVVTGEDTHSDSTVHARENVIHEIGLFQGRLGLERAIVLRQEGTSLPSNLAGLTYIGFKGRFAGAKKAQEHIRAALVREGLLSKDEPPKALPGTGASAAARPAPRRTSARGSEAPAPRRKRPASSPAARPRSG